MNIYLSFNLSLVNLTYWPHYFCIKQNLHTQELEIYTRLYSNKNRIYLHLQNCYNSFGFRLRIFCAMMQKYVYKNIIQPWKINIIYVIFPPVSQKLNRLGIIVRKKGVFTGNIEQNFPILRENFSSYLSPSRAMFTQWRTRLVHGVPVREAALQCLRFVWLCVDSKLNFYSML